MSEFDPKYMNADGTPTEYAYSLMIRCPGCSTRFIPNNNRHTYCDSNCYNKHWRKMNRHKAKTFKLNLDTGRLTMDQVGQARLSLHQGSDIAQDALPKGGLNEALGLDRLLAASDAAANKPQAPKPLDPYTEVLGKEPKK